MPTSKEPIRLRQRRTPSGLISLYLDIYIDGHRSYEYLKMYLVPERTRADKEKNKQTLLLADAIRSKRVVELRNGKYGFVTRATSVRFFEYYRSMCEHRLGKQSKANWGNWTSCLHHLRRYEKRDNITFEEITPEWVQGFRDYLERDAVAWAHDKRKRKDFKPLSRNSKVSYFNKLRACLNQAFEDRIIPNNPIRGIDGFKAEEGTRMYLTLEEVKKLAQTECDFPRIKAAFLFSCLTGLRRSDVLRLRWGDVHQQGDFTRLIFRQKKTDGLEYLDITAEAVLLMGDRGKAEDYIFTDILAPSATNNAIRVWVARAGIDKDITFHCARHTFAVMMLDLGTDIYTVSKLLGHRELSTTQIYAKVMDKNKQAAVSAIPSVLGGRNEKGEVK
ncbi:MAG: phage integrase SAM-like domain-containing protein [Prevotella sp.]